MRPALCAICAAVAIALPQLLRADWPPQIGRLDIVGGNDKLISELRSFIPQRSGDPLLLEELDYTTKLLSLRQDVATAAFRVVRKRGDRWDLELRVEPRRVLSHVRYRFDRRMNHGEEVITKPGSLLRLPANYDDGTTVTAADRLREELHRVGYRDAQVMPTVDWQTPNNGTLLLQVVLGSLYRVGAVEWSPADLPIRTRSRMVGLPWDADVIQTALAETLRDVRSAGYPAAEGTYECAAGLEKTATCRFHIDAGPRVRFEFVGAHTFFPADLAIAIALDPEGPLSIAELSRRDESIREFYRQNNFFFAEVTAGVVEEASETTVVFSIREGERRRFSSIEIHGIDEGSAKAVRDAIATSTRLLDRVFYGKDNDISRARRQEDLNRINYALQQMGYLEAKVASERFELRPAGVAWVIDVDPGRRYVWGNLRLPDAELREYGVTVPEDLTVGQPVDPSSLQRLADALAAALRDDGFLDAFARARLLPYAGSSAVSGVVDLYRGVRYRVAAVLVRGSHSTRESAILNVVPLEPDQIASAETLQKGRRLLLEKRVFRQVDARWMLRDPAVGRAVAMYELIERDGGELEAGLLITNHEGVGVDGRIGHRRLFGTFRQVAVNGSTTWKYETISSPSEGSIARARAGMHFREPYPGREPLYGEVVGSTELNRNEDDFHWISYSASVGGAWAPLLRLDVFGAYQYEWFKPMEIPPDGSTGDQAERAALSAALRRADVVRFDHIDTIGSLHFTAHYWDFDNQFDPRQGWATFQDVQIARREFGGDFSFLRYEGNLRYQKPLFGTVSFWFSGRGGAIIEEQNDAPLPRFKRFRLGGSNSVRGYQRDSVTPYYVSGDIAIPLGGRRFVNAQNEVRAGLASKLEIAAFFDVASVSGFSGPRANAAGSGAGLVYHTPAGPLRLDIGRALLDITGLERDPYAVHFYILGVF